jgi:nitrogen fixation NifU-like protein
MDLRELYQEIIVDHSRRPRNFGPLEGATHHAQGHNPLCGDQLALALTVDAGGRVTDARFEGQGCAISTASASTMTEAAKGHTVAELHQLFEAFHALVTGQAPPADAPELGKLEAFAGVSEFPMRVKCASLAWHTLEAALTQTPAAVTTE